MRQPLLKYDSRIFRNSTIFLAVAELKYSRLIVKIVSFNGSLKYAAIHSKTGEK
jgi:hypothetical protein